MIFEKKRQIHFELDRCCQCGACLAICHPGALRREWEDNGLFSIQCDMQRCILCKQCIDICPAHTISDHFLTENEWKQTQEVYLGHAIDDKIRFSASSGGVCRTIIHQALKQHKVDYIYCVTTSAHYPWAAGNYLNSTNVSSIANSKYLPVPVLENLKLGIRGTLLIVGTNCQLLAAEKFYAKSKKIKLLKICLLCKQQKTYDFTNFLAKHLNVELSKEISTEYRGNGWPGTVQIKSSGWSWEKAAALPYGKRLWTVPGCRFCANPLGFSADLTLADPWNLQVDAGSGMNLIMVRSDSGKELLKLCGTDIKLEKIKTEMAKKSIDWTRIKKNNKKIRFYKGEDTSYFMRIRYRMGEVQRSVYETILSRFKLPAIALKVLNRIPFIQ